MYMLNGCVNAITKVCGAKSYADIKDQQIKSTCSVMLDAFLYLAKKEGENDD